MWACQEKYKIKLNVMEMGQECVWWKTVRNGGYMDTKQICAAIKVSHEYKNVHSSSVLISRKNEWRLIYKTNIWRKSNGLRRRLMKNIVLDGAGDPEKERWEHFKEEKVVFEVMYKYDGNKHCSKNKMI